MTPIAPTLDSSDSETAWSPVVAPTASHGVESPKTDLLKSPVMLTPEQIRNRSRTKIVATLGPASSDFDTIRDLVVAGADVFRLNMAHGTIEDQQNRVDTIREVSRQLGFPVAILVDLAGPKFRLGEVANGAIYCERDQEFHFVPQGEDNEPNEITSTYAPLISELSVGNQVMLADGSVTMEVIGKKANRATLRVIQPGSIRSRQGINLPGVKLSAPAISVDDHQHAIWAAEAEVDFVSLSFVRKPDEVLALKDILKSSGSHARVVSKIEKREALERLEDIVEASDAVMVARGDLGVEIDVAEMPLEQKRIIRMCHRYEKPAIIATQMLESMHESQRPTRAEVTDVANAVLDGADATMLSGESAVGEYPREAVAMMNRIARATESSMRARPPREHEGNPAPRLHEITRAVVHGAGAMAYSLGAKLVVVASHKGGTALSLSQQRNFVPTVGVSTSERTLRQMCLYWGVTPLAGAPATDMQGLIRHADNWAREVGFASPGDRIVIVGGSHLAAGPDHDEMAAGVHDIVIVHEVEE